MPDLPSIPTAEPADESSPPLKAGEVQLDCVGCGSFVAYEPGTTGMICAHCGRRQPIDHFDDVDRAVRELDLGSALAATSTVRADEVVPNGHGFRCEDCGVQAVVEGWSGHCPYCDSPVVVVAEEGYDALVPGAVLPFDVSRERAQIGGDTQRIHSLEVVHEDTSFKYCLLPLWLATFHYRDEVYRFVVNARTGEARGERPYSLPKILLTLLVVVVAVIFLVAYLDGAFSS